MASALEDLEKNDVSKAAKDVLISMKLSRAYRNFKKGCDKLEAECAKLKPFQAHENAKTLRMISDTQLPLYIDARLRSLAGDESVTIPDMKAQYKHIEGWIDRDFPDINLFPSQQLHDLLVHVKELCEAKHRQMVCPPAGTLFPGGGH